ncbi:glycosyl hydrolase [Cohnella sp. GCM10020058]|uniref:glycosyl hydrolase n=1 Tax=Cohnella sp. GCM10020058 TaxID=3317330 RepID=UPI0036262864
MRNKWRFKALAALLLVTLIAPVSGQLGAGKAYAATPSNPNATQAVQDVLNYFDTVYANNKIISGQFVSDVYGFNEIDHIGYLASKYPAMLGMDFGYKHTNGTLGELADWRNYMVTQGIDYWKKGGLVQLSWHETNPLDTTPDDGGWNSVISTMTQTDFDKVTTPGTPEYAKWLAHIDMIAGYLKTLRDQGVVVLWRPYHEMNIGFWWGGKTSASFKKLWQNMYDRFTNDHGLNNLIWVWAPGRINDPINTTFYPGSSYVDLGGADVYVDASNNPKFTYANNELANVMGSKRYGLSEVAKLPDLAALKNNYDYTWILPWSTGWLDYEFYGSPNGNGPGNIGWDVRAFYQSPDTITRADVPGFGRTIVPETFIFKDAFNVYINGVVVSLSNWSTTATGGTVALSNEKTVGLAGRDLSMKISKTSTTGETSAKRTFGPQTGIVNVKASLRSEEASWKDFLIVDSSSPSKVALQIGIHNGSIRAYDGSTLVALQPIAYGKWYDVKAVLNTATKKYDVYVNGVKKGNQLSFRDTAAADLNKLAFGVAAGETGSLYVDNVRIDK